MTAAAVSPVVVAASNATDGFVGGAERRHHAVARLQSAARRPRSRLEAEFDASAGADENG